MVIAAHVYEMMKRVWRIVARDRDNGLSSDRRGGDSDSQWCHLAAFSSC